MFIYETKNLYLGKNGSVVGPFEGVVITNGEQGQIPAELDQEVLAIANLVGDANVVSDSGMVEMNPEENPHYIKILYNDQDVTGEELTLQVDDTLSVESDLEELSVSSSNNNVTVSIEDGIISIKVGATEESTITVFGSGTLASVYVTIIAK